MQYHQDNKIPLFGNKYVMYACGLISVSIILFFIFYPKYKDEKANQGILTKAVVNEFIRMPKGGFSMNYYYLVNDVKYLRGNSIKDSDMEYLSVGDTIWIKYDKDDYENTALIRNEMSGYIKRQNRD